MQQVNSSNSLSKGNLTLLLTCVTFYVYSYTGGDSAIFLGTISPHVKNPV